MYFKIIGILFIPFLGTVLGAGCVFFMRSGKSPLLTKTMNGFAAGVMIASSVWSLIIPATEMSSNSVIPPFLPAAIGLWVGIIFFFSLDKIIDKFKTPKPSSEQNHFLLTLLAIILHNFPEGMALGVMCAALIAESPQITLSAATSLAIGIGVQNFPEGSIISLPLHTNGQSKPTSFAIGILSAVAETLGSLLMILASTIVLPILPYVMCFAAGAMIFVVINELCPEISEGQYVDIGTLAFCVGFSLMMILDVALG